MFLWKRRRLSASPTEGQRRFTEIRTILWHPSVFCPVPLQWDLWWKWFLMKVVFWWKWFFDESGFWWEWLWRKWFLMRVILMKVVSDESGFWWNWFLMKLALWKWFSPIIRCGVQRKKSFVNETHDYEEELRSSNELLTAEKDPTAVRKTDALFFFDPTRWE